MPSFHQSKGQFIKFTAMKKLGIFLFVFFVAVTAGVAQNPQRGGGDRQFTPEDMAKRQTERLVESLSLNKAQETKVHDLNLKYAKKGQELRNQMRNANDQARQELRKKMTAQQAEKDVEMKKILTADQWKRYEALQKEMQQRMEQRRQGGGGGGF